METLARLVVRYRSAVLIAAIVAVTAAGIYGGGVASSLSNGGFSDPDAESVRAAETLAAEFGAAPPDVILVIRTEQGTIDDSVVATAATALTDELAAEVGVTQVSSYWTLGSPPGLRSDAADAGLVFASLAGSDGEVTERAAVLAEEYRGQAGPLEVLVGGSGPLFAEIQETIESDLARAEVIALPITLALLVVIFGSVVAASLPLGVGLFSIICTFAALETITRFTEVSIFSLNLTTALGLGLAIDYALFVVSRFREELAGGWAADEAARRTVLTAGRTVLFSAGTVAVSLAAMLVFPLSFLRSFGYAGIAVVALAALGAVVVLPAGLALLGHRVERLSIRQVRADTDGTGVWHRIATAVMRRPVPIATIAIVALVALGAPFLQVRLSQSDDRVLAPGSAAREVGDVLRDEFAAFEANSLDVVAAEGTLDDSASLAMRLSLPDSVARVDGPGGSYMGGTLVAPPTPASARFVSVDGFYLSVVPEVTPSSVAGEKLVTDIRALDSDVDFIVAGPAADLVDTKHSLFAALPWALGIIASVTFVVLFLMFGSLLVPAKAVALNMLSLSAAFGSMVWIFQEGHLSSILNFTPTGALDLTMPILMFCIAFGLSMDYEVFLLSRIKEEHDRGATNEAAVAAGLERTGRIVTAAALLIAVVFIAFATSSVTLIKMFGLGMTIAVLVDAFVVRATLVPAFMRLAGSANWWAPRWMRRLYDRFGISERLVLDPAPPKLKPEPATS